MVTHDYPSVIQHTLTLTQIRPFVKEKNAVSFPKKCPVFLKNFASIDCQPELGAQHLGRFSAHHHPAQENIKILIHGADAFIHLQIQGNDILFRIHLQGGTGNRIIHPVMDIRDIRLAVTDAALMGVGFVPQRQRCADIGGDESNIAQTCR